MSFWPFPKTVLTELRAGLERGPAIEFGSGAGGFARRLGEAGIHVLKVDRQPPTELRADAETWPFLPRRIGLCAVGNFVRHLQATSRRRFAEQAMQSLVSGGRLAVFEDTPAAQTDAERNYRTTLELLAEADPSRGAVVSLDPLIEEYSLLLGAPVLDETVVNEEVVQDVGAPLRWLASRGFGGDERLIRLQAAVAGSGMSYGRYRACIWSVEDTAR